MLERALELLRGGGAAFELELDVDELAGAACAGAAFAGTALVLERAAVAVAAVIA